MRAYERAYILRDKIERRTGVHLTQKQANILRRAEKTLGRWYEQECGDGNDYASWAIERDEASGIPYRVTYPHNGETHRARIADMERGAIRRAAILCDTMRLHYFVQTDPRGCSLYVSNEHLTDTNYTNGVACCD